MATKNYLIAFFSLAASITAAAQASETDQPMFKLGGFGTLGVSHSNQNLGDYVIDSTVPTGAGRSSDWSTGNDTRLGVQMTASFTPQTSAVLQLISEYQATGSYQPVIEWANVKYAFSPSVYIRAGRIDLPTFLYSDNRKVGYSFPWIHPPTELYRQLAITSNDGIDAMYRFGIGEAENSIKIIYGQNILTRPTSVSTSKDIRGIFNTIEYGSATLRMGYQVRESSSLSQLTGVTGAWGQNNDLSLAASYDPGNWFVISEWIQHQATTKVVAMSFSSGFRINKFTPYMAYSQSGQASFLSGNPAPTAAAIQFSLKSQSTLSVGTRWDFMKNIDVKLQCDQVHLGNNSNGYLANVPANVTLYGATFYVTSAVVDFVF
jgi:hypothetical protein